MKKLTMFILALASACSLFAQDATPNMLKQKQFFDKPDLFESPVIFADRDANEALIKDYETNKKSYAANQLIPVIVCYITMGQYGEAEKLLQTYLVANPKSVRALRMMGTICFITRVQGDDKGNAEKIAKAVSYYKKALEAGDENSVKSIASAYIMGGEVNKVGEVINQLKKLSKSDMEALTLTLIYALRDTEKQDDALLKEVLSSIDNKKILMSSNGESLQTVLRIYVAKRDIWPENALVIPGRAAAFAEAWPLALDIYKKAIKVNPKDTLALRGMSLVAYRTGGIMEAVDYIKKAVAAGDKSAASDGIEIFLLTGDKKIWEEFKSILPSITLSQVVRVGMIQYSEVRDAPDVFFAALEGDGSDLVFGERRLDKIVWDGFKKFESDSRVAAAKARWAKAGGSEESVKKIEAQIAAAKNGNNSTAQQNQPAQKKSKDDIGASLDKALGGK